MTEHRDEHLDLCAGYALGSLSEADRRRLDEHLAAGCTVCEQALADFSAATVMLAASAPAAQPRAELRERVLASLGDPGAASADERGRGLERGKIVAMRPRMSWVGWAWAAAAAALAVVSALSWQSANELKAQLEQSRQQITTLTQRLQEEERWAAVVNAPDARVAQLGLTPDGIAELRARATYDPATRKAVLVFENFKAPAGKDYELWALDAGGVTSLGVIKVDASGRAILRLDNAGDPAALAGFAVSLENAGGSGNPHAPGGPVVMAGKFGV